MWKSPVAVAAGTSASMGLASMSLSMTDSPFLHWLLGMQRITVTQLSWIFITCLVTGSLMGGYVAAHLAPRRPLTHAAAVGAWLLGSFALVSHVARGISFEWYEIVAFVLLVPASWAGGVTRNLEAQDERVAETFDTRAPSVR